MTAYGLVGNPETALVLQEIFNGQVPANPLDQATHQRQYIAIDVAENLELISRRRCVLELECLNGDPLSAQEYPQLELVLLTGTIGDRNLITAPALAGEPQRKIAACAGVALGLVPGVLTLYVKIVPARLVVEQRMTAARSVDVEHRVEVRDQFWGPQLLAEQPARTVPPALVYADLLATGDGRFFEAARLIYDRHLAELFAAA